MLQEVEPGRFQTVATLKGSGGGKSLMLNGHIDIDPLAMGWKRDPWVPSIEGDFIFGAGIRNMKSGVSSMITAAEAVRNSGVTLPGDLVLACVVGELQGGVGSTYLTRNGPLTDMAVVPEPFGANNILTTHAGVLEMAVHVLGNSRHISRKEESRRRHRQDVQGRAGHRRGGVHLHAPRRSTLDSPASTSGPSSEVAGATTTCGAPTSSPTSAPSSLTSDSCPE